EGDRTQQFWTLPWVPGPRYTNKPVYVLTSARTFSGAEEFAYNLKALKRATLIGETTGGGANPGDEFLLAPHYAAFIPTGRAVNPVTGTNWEGTGVAPDIAVPAAEAMKVAQRLGLEHVIAQLGEAPVGPRELLMAEAQQALAELDTPPAGAQRTDEHGQTNT